jgi:hypothetical protein
MHKAGKFHDAAFVTSNTIWRCDWQELWQQHSATAPA